MSTEEYRASPVRQEYGEAVQALKPILRSFDPKIVAIDGRCGTGKTTLGRFLAWRFNVTLIETDLFLQRNRGQFIYRISEIDGVLDGRMKSELPVILEGVVALRILNDLKREPAFHIHLICDEADGTPITDREWEMYDAEYSPAQNADLLLHLPPI